MLSHFVVLNCVELVNKENIVPAHPLSLASLIEQAINIPNPM